MLRICCPYCGVRDEPEFVFGGTSNLARPPPDASHAQWGDYLFNKDNPKGLHNERWLHAYGCGRWFNAVRDTMTHEFLAVYRMGDPKPLVPSLDEGSSR